MAYELVWQLTRVQSAQCPMYASPSSVWFLQWNSWSIHFFLSQSHEKLKEKIQMKKTKKYWLSISDDHANTINKCMQLNWLQALLFNRLMFGFNEGYKSCNELASRILNQCRLPECILNNRISFAPEPARLSSFKCEFCLGFFLNALLYFVN